MHVQENERSKYPVGPAGGCQVRAASVTDTSMVSRKDGCCLDAARFAQGSGRARRGAPAPDVHRIPSGPWTDSTPR